jgi:hypothetical protein
MLPAKVPKADEQGNGMAQFFNPFAASQGQARKSAIEQSDVQVLPFNVTGAN